MSWLNFAKRLRPLEQVMEIMLFQRSCHAAILVAWRLALAAPDFVASRLASRRSQPLLRLENRPLVNWIKGRL